MVYCLFCVFGFEIRKTVRRLVGGAWCLHTPVSRAGLAARQLGHVRGSCPACLRVFVWFIYVWLQLDERWASLSVCYPGPARFRGIRVVVADACNKRRARPCLVRLGGCSWECLKFIYIYALYLMKPGCMYAGRVRASCMHKTAVLHLWTIKLQSMTKFVVWDYWL